MTTATDVATLHRELGSIKAVRDQTGLSYVSVQRLLKEAGVVPTRPVGTSTVKCPNCLTRRDVVPGRPIKHGGECSSCHHIDTAPIEANPPTIQWVKSHRWGVLVGVVHHDPHQDVA